MQRKTKVFLALCALFLSLLTSPSCSRGEPPILVVPGKSIAGVELGASRQKVLSTLGIPIKEISSKDPSQLGEVRTLGRGIFAGGLPTFSILLYSSPPLAIVIDQDNTVGALQLGYTDSIRVEGYDFLKFKYLTKDEIDQIGEPSSVVRDKKSEEKALSTAPKGTKIEYYVYEYDRSGLTLGFIFDRAREQSNKSFISLNYISVSSRKPLPSSQ